MSIKTHHFDADGFGVIKITKPPYPQAGGPLDLLNERPLYTVSVTNQRGSPEYKIEIEVVRPDQTMNQVFWLNTNSCCCVA